MWAKVLLTVGLSQLLNRKQTTDKQASKQADKQTNKI